MSDLAKEGQALCISEERNLYLKEGLMEAMVVEEDTSLPGFADAVGASWDFLKLLFGLAVLVVGAVVPFIWLLAVVAGIIWWRRRRSATTAVPVAADDGASMPPPPTV